MHWEIATLGQMAEVAVDALQKAGLNIEIVWNDWGTVGQRLRNSLPEDAFLARWGSDEFLVVLAQGSGDTEVRASAQVVLAALAGRFELGLHEVRITPTMGAVLAPQDGADFSLLLRKADSAMYAGKERGRNCLVFFDASLDNVPGGEKK